jgi:hypothetical protein
MINADYRDLSDEEAAAGSLNLSQDDALPWLETDEEDEGNVGVDTAQIVAFIAVLAAVFLGVVGLIWFLTNKTGDAAIVADGSTIEAPAGPYKVRPDDPDAKEFPGTGDVAPAVGDGQSPDARLAGNTGAESGDQDLGIAMPPIAGGAGSIAGAGEPGARARTIEPRAATPSAPSPAAASSAPADSGRVGVQLAAYSSQARAEQGWQQISRRTTALSGMTPTIEKGEAGIGTVYRLKALTGSRAEADALCRTLRNQGIDCAVKP